MGLRLGSNFSIPIGDWYEGVNAGIGYEGDFFTPVSRSLALRFHFSRAGLDVDNDFFYFPEYIDFRKINQESSITALRYLLFLQYNELTIEQKPNKTSFYACAGLGAITHKMKGEIVLEEISTGDYYLLEAKDDKTDFMMSSIIGIVYTVSSTIGLDGSLSIDCPFVSVENEHIEAFIIDFKVGVILIL